MQAKVRVGKGRTVNTGNYESSRFDYSIEIEVEYEKIADLLKVKKKAEELVLEWVDEQMAEFE